MKKVTIYYFASLKEQRGLPGETIETEAANIGTLYEDLAQRHSLNMDIKKIRVARNECFCEPDATFENGDKIAFLPPVAGG